MKENTSVIPMPAQKPQVLTKIQPPPRKEDVIKAMLERARQKFVETETTRKAAASELRAKIEKLALAELKKQKPRARFSLYCSSGSVEVEYSVESPEMKALLSEYRSLDRRNDFDEQATKAMIRRGLDNTGERVQALLSNPEAVKQMDALLAKIAS